MPETKKKAKKKAKTPKKVLAPVGIPAGQLIDAPVAPETTQSVSELAQEALDRLGTATWSQDSQGNELRWLRQGDYNAVEARLVQILAA